MKIYDLASDAYMEVQVALLKMWCDNILTDAEYYRISNRVRKMEKQEEKNETD